jgi:hypothetical protein
MAALSINNNNGVSANNRQSAGEKLIGGIMAAEMQRKA